MFGRVSDELEVNVPASQAWEVYGTLKLAKLAAEELSDMFDKIEVEEGDGGAGTVLKLSFPPGTPLLSWYKERFTKVDDEKRVKETEVIEGGYLDLGFTSFRVRLEVVEKDENSCITRATAEYEVKEEAAANASFVTIQPLLKIMKVAANYLLSVTNNKN